MNENKTSRYLKYAIGEIILVVIGILIALQINNWNEDRKTRQSEIKYLTNIKLDIERDLVALDTQIKLRKNKFATTESLILHIDGVKPISDLDVLSKNVFSTINEERFTPNNSTYTELTSSGNLSLIENDSIKRLLLELEELYKDNQFGIEHEAFEYKEYINKQLFKFVDMDKLKKAFYKKVSAKNYGLNFKHFDNLLKSLEYKNGLTISNTISQIFIESYEEIKNKSTKLLEIIKKELKND
tara:strand:+ start:3274 stop:3999 length:726 start_codon:yes stop_codon:yes gene_type:complete